MNTQSTGTDEKLAEADTALMLERQLAPVAKRAASALATIRGVAATFAVAGFGLWLLAVLSLQLLSGWKITIAVLMFLFLLLPGTVWTLISIGVGQIAGLPKRLLAVAAAGHEHVQSGIADVRGKEESGFLKRIFRVLRSITNARGAVLESQVIVAESVALVRVFNPATLVIAGVTFAGGILVVATVLIVGVVMRLM